MLATLGSEWRLEHVYHPLCQFTEPRDFVLEYGGVFRARPWDYVDGGGQQDSKCTEPEAGLQKILLNLRMMNETQWIFLDLTTIQKLFMSQPMIGMS